MQLVCDKKINDKVSNNISIRKKKEKKMQLVRDKKISNKENVITNINIVENM